MKIPKELKNKEKKVENLVPLIKKKHNCPVCQVELRWTPTNLPCIFIGSCPKCGMEFTYNKGLIVGGVKSSLS